MQWHMRPSQEKAKKDKDVQAKKKAVVAAKHADDRQRQRKKEQVLHRVVEDRPLIVDAPADNNANGDAKDKEESQSASASSASSLSSDEDEGVFGDLTASGSFKKRKSSTPSLRDSPAGSRRNSTSSDASAPSSRTGSRRNSNAPGVDINEDQFDELADSGTRKSSGSRRGSASGSSRNSSTKTKRNSSGLSALEGGAEASPVGSPGTRKSSGSSRKSSRSSSRRNSTSFDPDSAEASPVGSPGTRKSGSNRGSARKSSKMRDSSTKDSLTFDWDVDANPGTPEMMQYIQVNCLHRGVSALGTKTWMVPVDSTRASMLAFEECVKKAGKEDHIIVIHVRVHERDLVYYPIKESYLEWYNDVQLLKRYFQILREREQGAFTILLPSSDDARKIIIKFANKLNVDTIVLGKHTDKDKDLRVKHNHIRSFSSYIKAEFSKKTLVVKN